MERPDFIFVTGCDAAGNVCFLKLQIGYFYDLCQIFI